MNTVGIGLTVSAALLLAASASAQSPFDTADFDMSGTWEVDPTTFPAHNEIQRCDVSMGNRFMWGGDSFTIKLTEVSEVQLEDQFREFVVLSYVGTYRHRHTFIFTPQGPDAVQQYCGFFGMGYDVTATLKVYLDDPNRAGRFLFSLQGSAPEQPAFDHDATMSINSPTTGIRIDHFSDPDGRTFVAEMDFGNRPMARPEAPASCSYSSIDPGGGLNCGTGLFVRFRRSDRAPDITLKAPISGRLKDTLPDGTQTQDPVTNATVRLLRQAEAVRPQGAGESDANYQLYLNVIADSSVVVKTLELSDPNGRLAFSDVELFGPKRSGVVLRGLYTVDVGQAHRNVDLGGGQVVRIDYLPRQIYNIKAGDAEQDHHLRAADVLSVKSRLAVQLKTLAPHSYGPTEDAVLNYINSLVGLPNGPNEMQLEGVRRALWSERATLYGATYAKTYLKEMLTAFGSIVADLVGRKFTTKDAELSGAEEKLNNFREAQWAAAKAKGFWSGDTQAVRDAMSSSLSKDKRTRNALAAKNMKLMIKYMIITPINNQLTDPEHKRRLSLFSSALNAIVDIVFSREWKGALQLAIKEITKSFADDLFDSALPIPTYSSGTQGALALSSTQMQSWARNDSGAFQGSRARALAHIQTMNDRAVIATTALETAKLIAEASANAEEIFGLLEVVPAFKTAKKASEYAKYASNLTAFAAPAVMVYGELPRSTNAATEAIFDLRGVRAVQGDRLLPPTSFNGDLWPQAAAALELLADDGANGLGAVETALNDDDLGLAIALLAGTQGTLRTEADNASRLTLRLIAASEGTITATTTLLGERIGHAAAELASYEEELELVGVSARELLLRVVEDAFESPTDPLYLAERNHLLRQVDGLRASLQRLLFQGSQLAFVGGESSAYRVALVESLTVASDTTGQSEISTSAESFTVTAVLRNLNTAPINDVTARLIVSDPTGSATVSGSQDHTVALLAAYDGVEGSGADEPEVRWTVSFDGDVSNFGRAAIRVELLENAGPPVSFFGTGDAATLGPALSVSDTDLDGMPNAFEAQAGLQLEVNDAQADLDGDGLSNIREYLLGTRADLSDTDGDGLSDGEEVRGPTDPVVADTDGDGTDDGADGAPVDGTSTAASTPIPQPVLQLSSNEVQIDEQTRLARIQVSNAGAGTLSWTAVVENEAVVRVNPSLPSIRTGPGELFVTLAPSVSGLDLTSRVFVAAVGTDDPQLQAVAVVVGEGSVITPTDGGPGLDAPGNDGAQNQPDAGSVSDGGGVDAGVGPGGDEGCGCRSSEPSSTNVAVLAVLAIALLRRRRR